jgi:uncharacterized protein (DUF1501 family)
VVRLRGGADGLSILPPHGDPGSYPARPGIAMPPPGRGARAAIDLDGFFGLHPALAPLVPLFRAREVDVWPACRVPGATTSHLRADLALDELLAELRAEPVAPAAVPLDGAPASPFGCALGGLRTRLERADDAPVLVVESRDWDHHGGHTADATLDARVDDLARGLAALVRQLGDRLSQTTIVTISEFGRAIAENAHGGTEHGDATLLLVMGGGVRRGHIRGTWPGLGSATGLRATASVSDVLRSVC